MFGGGVGPGVGGPAGESGGGAALSLSGSEVRLSGGGVVGRVPPPSLSPGPDSSFPGERGDGSIWGVSSCAQGSAYPCQIIEISPAHPGAISW